MSGRLRCWPGCLAYITHPSMYGVTVEVLYTAPVGRFTLPDGFPAWHPGGEPGWVCRFARPIQAPVDFRGERMTRAAHYATIDDRHLRPLLPPPGTESTTTDKPMEVA